MKFFKRCRYCDTGFTSEKSFRIHMNGPAKMETSEGIKERTKTKNITAHKRRFVMGGFGG